jgi:hypothetical protein
MLGLVRRLFQAFFHVASDLRALIAAAMRSRAQVAAENLFLRKQVALYRAISTDILHFLARVLVIEAGRGCNRPANLIPDVWSANNRSVPDLCGLFD